VSRKVDGSAAAFDLEEVFDFMEDGAVVMLIRECIAPFGASDGKPEETEGRVAAQNWLVGFDDPRAIRALSSIHPDERQNTPPDRRRQARRWRFPHFARMFRTRPQHECGALKGCAARSIRPAAFNADGKHARVARSSTVGRREQLVHFR
jgi:hypothetical protein